MTAYPHGQVVVYKKQVNVINRSGFDIILYLFTILAYDTEPFNKLVLNMREVLMK